MPDQGHVPGTRAFCVCVALPSRLRGRNVSVILRSAQESVSPQILGPFRAPLRPLSQCSEQDLMTLMQHGLPEGAAFSRTPLGALHRPSTQKGLCTESQRRRPQDTGQGTQGWGRREGREGGREGHAGRGGRQAGRWASSAQRLPAAPTPRAQIQGTIGPRVAFRVWS